MRSFGVVTHLSGLTRITEAQRAAARQSVKSGAAMTGAYLGMNAAATLIAGFGLLENSPAVIIGAMLIAMLFGPIVGIALGLAEADMALLGRSIVSEVIGAAWVLVIAYGIGLVFRDLPIGSEVLSRTSPGTLDLLIALVGGLAGAFTYFATGISGVMVGVAIATALVPPLTTCGILLARGLTGPATGAFLLFLANFAAISLGAMVGFPSRGTPPAGRGPGAPTSGAGATRDCGRALRDPRRSPDQHLLTDGGSIAAADQHQDGAQPRARADPGRAAE